MLLEIFFICAQFRPRYTSSLNIIASYYLYCFTFPNFTSIFPQLPHNKITTWTERSLGHLVVGGISYIKELNMSLQTVGRVSLSRWRMSRITAYITKQKIDWMMAHMLLLCCCTHKSSFYYICVVKMFRSVGFSHNHLPFLYHLGLNTCLEMHKIQQNVLLFGTCIWMILYMCYFIHIQCFLWYRHRNTSSPFHTCPSRIWRRYLEEPILRVRQSIYFSRCFFY